ncbi:MAG: hypothetical protein Kow0069_06130 [Promethearchaeota archaeon]
MTSDNLPPDLRPFWDRRYLTLFERVRQIRDPVKLRVLQELLDGRWHDERDLVRLVKKYRFLGSVGLGTLVDQLLRVVDPEFVEQKDEADRVSGRKYKLNANYVGLTRAAFHTFTRRAFRPGSGPIGG